MFDVYAVCLGAGGEKHHFSIGLEEDEVQARQVAHHALCRWADYVLLQERLGGPTILIARTPPGAAAGPVPAIAGSSADVKAQPQRVERGG